MTDDTYWDPTRTEDVEERILSPREFREKCEDLRLYGADDPTGDPRAKDKLAMSHEALRERLEEVEERAETMKRKVNKWIFRRSAARRRVDRLEEAVREAELELERGKRRGTLQARGISIDAALSYLRSALDSREDEGRLTEGDQTDYFGTDCECGHQIGLHPYEEACDLCDCTEYRPVREGERADCTCRSWPHERPGPTGRIPDPMCPVHKNGLCVGAEDNAPEKAHWCDGELRAGPSLVCSRHTGTRTKRGNYVRLDQASEAEK